MRMPKALYFLLLSVACSSALYSQNANNHNEMELGFECDGIWISGKLITPLNAVGQKLPTVVFVHGSGPEDHSSSGNFDYLFEQFTRIGFACYSWDRPGVGQSQGKWYERGVKSRAREVVEAVRMLGGIETVDSGKIGFWGISQAGWVMPEAAERVEPAFVISVSSPATTAIEQELYRVRATMSADGRSRKDIRRALAYTREVNALVGIGKPFGEFAKLQDRIKQQSWTEYVITGEEIVHRYLSMILKEDRAPAFENFKGPVLAIWGENDLVVPPLKSARIFERRMRALGNEGASSHIVSNADHTLTYNPTGLGSHTTQRREQYRNKPDEIFAPGYVTLMVNWLQGLFDEP